jgi:hypothetical protein
MGWTESPAYFCATTETGRDVIQALIDAKDEQRTPYLPMQWKLSMVPAFPARWQTELNDIVWQMTAV